MTKRNDVTVDWTVSPRRIDVAAPSVELTVQDLLDTARQLEDDIENLSYLSLIDAAGKEPLGGGVTVGITAELQDAQVSFAARTTSVSAGTITTPNVAGTTLIDAAADFITDAVVPGAWIVNVTDQSLATVLEVVDLNTLTVEPLADGTDNQFDSADVYKIWNVIQCDLAGGNLVAIDSVGGELDPVFPTAGTQIVRVSSSSATLQELSAIQYSSFGGGVSIDVTSSNTGTDYPMGTPEFPLNNVADAHLVADTRGFNKFFVIGNLTVATEDVSDAHVFIGQSQDLTMITIDGPADVTSCEFQNCTVLGTLDGGNTLRDCSISSLIYVQGHIIDCELNTGIITLGGSQQATFVNCHSGISGAGYPCIDFGGSGQSLVVSGYVGKLQMDNLTGAENVSVLMLAGDILLNSTLTAGTITISGTAVLTDNSNGATIDTTGLMFADQMQLAAFNQRIALDVSGGTAGTGFPQGTEQNPVNNLADAKTIATERGIGTILLTGTLVVGASDVVDGLRILGVTPATSIVVMLAGATNQNTTFERVTLTGVMDGSFILRAGAAYQISNVGHDSLGTAIVESQILSIASPAIQMRAGLSTPQSINFFNSFSGDATGSNGPQIDLNGSGAGITTFGWIGTIKLANWTSGQVGSLNLDGGEVEIESSCTAGTLNIHGLAAVDNSSGVGFTVATSGLVYADQLQLTSFDGAVTLDTISGTAGVDYPVGTEQTPALTFIDAVTIATARGLHVINLKGNLSLGMTDNADGLTIRGQGATLSEVTLVSGASTASTLFEDLTLTGEVDGDITCRRCEVSFLTNVGSETLESKFYNCIFLKQTPCVQLRAGLSTPQKITTYDSFSGGVGHGGPTFDMNGSGAEISHLNWVGGLKFDNWTGGQNGAAEMITGHITVNASCTTGKLVVHGVTMYNDNSTGTFNMDVGGIVNEDTIADTVWDTVLSGSSHNIQNSAGKRLRDLASQVIHTDTAQGPAVNGNQIQLALAASSVDGTYDPSLVFIRDGTGVGQARNILQYEGSTRIATVDRNWKVNPDGTSEYVIVASAGREHVNEGLAQGGTSTTITLNALASSIDDVYLHQTVFIRSGTGDDQVGIVIGYDGTTKIATIDGTWAVVPDTTSGYVMLPRHNNVSTEQFAAYGGVITIDTVNGTPGTAYPVGTGVTPAKTLADAKVLAAAFGIIRLRVVGTLIVLGSENIDGLVLEGVNQLVDVVSMTTGCSTVSTTFRDMTVAGTVDGAVLFDRCALSNISNIGSDVGPSLANFCFLLQGTLAFRAGLTTPGNVQFLECSEGQGASGITIDMNGTTQLVAFRDYRGKMKVANYTGGQECTFEFNSGSLTVEASCTTGTLVYGGDVSVTNNSTGSMVVRGNGAFAKILSIVKALLGMSV